MATTTIQGLYADLVNKAGACAEALNEGKSSDEVKNLKKMASDALDRYNVELLGKANACAEALNEGKSSDEVKNLKKMASDALDRYNTEAAKKANLEWAEAGDVVANALNKELAGNVNFSYEIDEAARAFEFSKDADPASNKSVTKALQQCIDGVLYIPINDAKGNEVNGIKVLGKHWTYVRECMTRQGKAPGQVLISGTGKMSELIADIIHQLLVDEGRVFLNVSD